jgi:hypothetical protein
LRRSLVGFHICKGDRLLVVVFVKAIGCRICKGDRLLIVMVVKAIALVVQKSLEWTMVGTIDFY